MGKNSGIDYSMMDIEGLQKDLEEKEKRANEKDDLMEEYSRKIREIAKKLCVENFWEGSTKAAVARSCGITESQLSYKQRSQSVISNAMDVWQTARDAVFMQLPFKGNGHWQFLAKNILGMSDKTTIEPGEGWANVVRSLSGKSNDPTTESPDKTDEPPDADVADESE